MSRMKLILTQEVGGLGTPGDVVDVTAGYGRNYLLPRGFAMPWTRGAEKQVDLIKRARSAREIRTLEDAQVVAAQLERLTVRIKDLDLGAGERPSLGLYHLFLRLRQGVRGVSGNLGEPVVSQRRPTEYLVHRDPALPGKPGRREDPQA